MKWLYFVLGFFAVLFGCAGTVGLGATAFVLVYQSDLAASYAPLPTLAVSVQPLVAAATLVPMTATPLAHPGEAGPKQVGLITPVPTATKAAPPTPIPTPTRPASQTDPIVKIEIVGVKVKLVAEVQKVFSYCFAADGSKAAQIGPCLATDVSGDYRWDVPGAQGKDIVGWQVGYPKESVLVINGHRDSLSDRAGHAFRDLQFLQTGDKLTITTMSGKQFFYVMYNWELLALSDPRIAWAVNGIQTEGLPADVVITYTCGGDLKADPKTGRIQYTSRRLIYWKPVETIPPK